MMESLCRLINFWASEPPHNFFLSGNFAPVPEPAGVSKKLPVTGTLPVRPPLPCHAGRPSHPAWPQPWQHEGSDTYGWKTPAGLSLTWVLDQSLDLRQPWLLCIDTKALASMRFTEGGAPPPRHGPSVPGPQAITAALQWRSHRAAKEGS